MRMPRAGGQSMPADALLTVCLVVNEVHMRTVKQLHKRLVRLNRRAAVVRSVS